MRAPANARDAEVVAHDRNSRIAEIANNFFYIFELRLFFRAVEQNVVPMRRIKIFNRFEFQTFGFDAFAQINQFFGAPKFIWIAGQAPAAFRAGRLVVARIFRAVFEIIHQMRDDVCRARLPRELKILTRQHVPVKSESEFHQ